MKRSWVRQLHFVVLGCTALTMVGCGVSEKKLKAAEARLQVLSEKGVPDSVLSTPKLLIFEVRTANRLGDALKAKKSADSALKVIAAVEQQAAAQLQELKPKAEAMIAGLKARRGEFSGLRVRILDSMLTIADSFATQSWYPQATDQCAKAEALLPALAQSEAKAKQLGPKLIGTWNRTEKSDFGGVWKTKYTFKKDGAVEIIDEKSGQSNPVFKEFWKFQSWGTFDLRNDSIFLFVNREKCAEQTYWNLVQKDGKQEWKKDIKPTYDTTITNGKKDQVLEYQYLTQFFKK